MSESYLYHTLRYAVFNQIFASAVVLKLYKLIAENNTKIFFLIYVEKTI